MVQINKTSRSTSHRAQPSFSAKTKPHNPALRSKKSFKTSTKPTQKTLHAALKPHDQEVIIFDIDETLLAGDKHVIDQKRKDQIEKLGDRKVTTIPADHPDNKFGKEISYVLRPGTQELLEYLAARGYKVVCCTRNHGDRAETIIKTNPVLNKHVDGILGREDLLSELNRDFKKYPHHPDNLGFWQKLKCLPHTVFVYTPFYVWRKTKAVFTGENIRWSPGRGELGKYPPNMIELLKAKGNHKLDGCKKPRVLVDNQDVRELADSCQSRDFAWVNPDVDRNGDGKATDFFDDSVEPKIKLTDPETKKPVEGYLWVKQVVEGIERGWQEQFKVTTGKKPIIDEPNPKQLAA